MGLEPQKQSLAQVKGFVYGVRAVGCQMEQVALAHAAKPGAFGKQAVERHLHRIEHEFTGVQIAKGVKTPVPTVSGVESTRFPVPDVALLRCRGARGVSRPVSR